MINEKLFHRNTEENDYFELEECLKQAGTYYALCMIFLITQAWFSYCRMCFLEQDSYPSQSCDALSFLLRNLVLTSLIPHNNLFAVCSSPVTQTINLNLQHQALCSKIYVVRIFAVESLFVISDEYKYFVLQKLLFHQQYYFQH
jgi:hypothetical protein